MKAWENKQVFESQLMANAFYNAYINANRKKNTQPQPLWKKRRNRKEDIKELDNKFNEVIEYEKKNGNDWIKLIYERSAENGG